MIDHYRCRKAPYTRRINPVNGDIEVGGFLDERFWLKTYCEADLYRKCEDVRSTHPVCPYYKRKPSLWQRLLGWLRKPL